jgi:hypothetical protein
MAPKSGTDAKTSLGTALVSLWRFDYEQHDPGVLCASLIVAIFRASTSGWICCLFCNARSAVGVSSLRRGDCLLSLLLEGTEVPWLDRERVRGLERNGDRRPAYAQWSLLPGLVDGNKNMLTMPVYPISEIGICIARDLRQTLHLASGLLLALLS